MVASHSRSIAKERDADSAQMVSLQQNICFFIVSSLPIFGKFSSTKLTLDGPCKSTPQMYVAAGLEGKEAKVRKGGGGWYLPASGGLCGETTLRCFEIDPILFKKSNEIVLYLAFLV